MCSALTQAVAAKHFRYEPETGELFWLMHPAKNKSYLAGVRAGTIEQSGYWYVRLFGRSYQQHRLIWLLTFGGWPSGVIDHIDGNPLNNRLENLRDVTPAINAMNKHKARKDSKTGLIGVRQIGSGNWNAYIYRGGVKFNLGTHSTAEAASAAYQNAKATVHQESAHV